MKFKIITPTFCVLNNGWVNAQEAFDQLVEFEKFSLVGTV